MEVQPLLLALRTCKTYTSCGVLLCIGLTKFVVIACRIIVISVKVNHWKEETKFSKRTNNWSNNLLSESYHKVLQSTINLSI